MNIRRLTMKGFTRHEDTRLDFPDRGVVLVTGANGSGKSSIAEAPCVALFGEMLRGTTPWQDGRNGIVSVDFGEGLHVERRRSAKKTTLEWANGKKVAYENTTKAQEALEHVVGTFDVWRRSRVFSSQDAGHFTLATDAERKRLLETILGLDKFDSALNVCKLDLKGTELRVSNTERESVVLAERLKSVEARISDVEATLSGLDEAGNVPELEKKRDKLYELVSGLQTQAGPLKAELSMLANSTADQRAALRDVEKRRAKVSRSQCGECGQMIPEEMRRAAESKLREEEDAARAAETNLVTTAEYADAQLADIRSDLEKLQERFNDADRKLFSAQFAEGQRCTHRLQIEKLRREHGEVAAKLGKVDEQLAQARQEAAELAACTSVLGIKGVRAHVLGRALGGLERVANSWLARIAGPGLSLSLKPYVERKSGGVSDSIALEVAGAGGGLGYKACSGGERRRIDVAILLALAEVAQAVSGSGGGTIFLDEIFDSLDAAGVEAVGKAIGELARDRAVVVISHSQEVVENLRPTVHWKISEGKVESA